MSAFGLAGRSPRGLRLWRSVAILAMLLCVLAFGPSADSTAEPFLGHWHGETRGPVVTDLVLHGRIQDGGGTYDIGLLDHTAGSIGPFNSAWSGHWIVVHETVDGRQRTEIRLQHPLNDMIDRYFIGPGNVLQPTPDLVGRPLTRQEIAEYSLTPVSGGSD